MTFSPTVLEAIPNQKARWLGKVGIRGLFDGEHSFTIDPRAGGGARFIHRERFSGILVPLFGGVIRKAESGFEEMNKALKTRAEGRR